MIVVKKIWVRVPEEIAEALEEAIKHDPFKASKSQIVSEALLHYLISEYPETSLRLMEKLAEKTGELGAAFGAAWLIKVLKEEGYGEKVKEFIEKLDMEKLAEKTGELGAAELIKLLRIYKPYKGPSVVISLKKIRPRAPSPSLRKHRLPLPRWIEVES